MTDTTLSAEASALKFDAVYATSVPGLVLWRWPRRVLRRVTGEKVRSASYSLTHEPSGYALLAGVNGAKHTLRLAEGLDLAAMLGDLRYKNRPIDWTQDIDALHENRNVRVALLILAEFRLIAEDYPPAVCSWAERNGIDLTIKLPKVTGDLMAQAERGRCDS